FNAATPLKENRRIISPLANTSLGNACRAVSLSRIHSWLEIIDLTNIIRPSISSAHPTNCDISGAEGLVRFPARRASVADWYPRATDTLDRQERRWTRPGRMRVGLSVLPQLPQPDRVRCEGLKARNRSVALASRTEEDPAPGKSAMLKGLPKNQSDKCVGTFQ